METKELLKKVRAIEIRTKQISMQMFSGNYHSKFKGRGMSFRENREYYSGDDIRSINWNVTAKMNTPYTKVFEEERELNALILVDISSSNLIGSGKQTKRDLITEISAVLSMSAIQNKDKVGVLFFSDVIEKYIPPAGGKSHVLKIIRDLVHLSPVSKKTDINQALIYANRMLKKRSIIFLISDFKADNYSDNLKRTNLKHSLTAIQIIDKRETQMSDLGLVQLKDAESGKLKWVNTSSSKTRKKYNSLMTERQDGLEKMFLKSGINTTQIYTDLPYVKPLTALFQRGK